MSQRTFKTPPQATPDQQARRQPFCCEHSHALGLRTARTKPLAEIPHQSAAVLKRRYQQVMYLVTPQPSAWGTLEAVTSRRISKAAQRPVLVTHYEHSVFRDYVIPSRFGQQPVELAAALARRAQCAKYGAPMWNRKPCCCTGRGNLQATALRPSRSSRY